MTRLVLTLTLGFALTAPPATTEPSVPPEVIIAAMRSADCSLSYDDASQDWPQPQELGGGLKLIEIPCWRAAYNAGSIFFAADPAAAEAARLLRFRVWDGEAFAEQYSLTFSSYDPARQRLTSLHKGRGLGDCGSAGQWTWSGSEFVLESYWLEEECDGRLFDPESEPELWRVYPELR
jgi:hypothetical protein